MYCVRTPDRKVNFGQNCWVSGHCVKKFGSRFINLKIAPSGVCAPASHYDVGQAEGLACADPGARTPIGMSRHFSHFFDDLSFKIIK